MESIFVNEIGRIKKAQKDIEKALDVRIKITKGGIDISSKDGMNEYLAMKVIEALNLGFKASSALKLKNEDYMLEVISIKKHARPSRLSTIKGRLIGREGRSLEILSELTNCDIRIKDYDVGIIGQTYEIKFAVNAIIMLIHGSPHSSVYAYLEKSKPLREMKEEEKGRISL